MLVSFLFLQAPHLPCVQCMPSTLYKWQLIIGQASIAGVSVKGLKGCKTLNKDPDPSNPLEGKEERFVCLPIDESNANQNV